MVLWMLLFLSVLPLPLAGFAVSVSRENNSDFFKLSGTFAALWNKSSALFQGMRFPRGRMLVQQPLNGPTVFEMLQSDWQRDFIIVIILSFIMESLHYKGKKEAAPDVATFARKFTQKCNCRIIYCNIRIVYNDVMLWITL